MNWTSAQLARLTELSREGLSARIIADRIATEFGEPCTRNAVCGKWSRRDKWGGIDRPPRQKREPVSKAYELAAEQPPNPVTLLDRNEAQCPYPIWSGDGWPDFFVCGAVKGYLDRFCNVHMAITHNAPPKRPSREDGALHGRRKPSIGAGISATTDLRDGE